MTNAPEQQPGTVSQPIKIAGLGAVSPAGWGVAPLRQALGHGKPLPCSNLVKPGRQRPLRVRQAPATQRSDSFWSHTRLRRVSPITRYAVAAAMEALENAKGDSPTWWGESSEGTGKVESRRRALILCVMTGCVSYSRRFYDEVLRQPSTASPLLFPETVFNAPASHLAALLGITGISYTLVGDPGTFLQGLALGANWLANNRVDECLVIGAEEMDWIVADSFEMFSRKIVLGEGAGALLLRRSQPKEPGVRLQNVSTPFLFARHQTRPEAARKMRAELPFGDVHDLLCDGLQGSRRLDRHEEDVWSTWRGTRMSPKRILGEGLTAAAAWQCVAAVDALQNGKFASASVSVVGCNQQAIGAHFTKSRG